MTIENDINFKKLSNIWLKKATVGVTYTYKCNLESYVKHLNRYLSEKKIKDIKPYDIDFIIQELAIRNPNTNKTSSKKFLNNIISCAIRIFDFAVENELIYKNPAKNKKKEIPRNAPHKVVNAINSEQQQLVINVEHRAKIAAVIMMFMGLRTGELLALEWSDIDLDNLKLSVNKRAQRNNPNEYIVVPGTKNGKTRFVSIPSNLGLWLKKEKSVATSYLVLPNRQGTLNSPTQWRGLWKSYQNDINYYCYKQKCKEANIKYESKYSPHKIPQISSKFNPHQLRHTYATLLYISGVDVLTASELLGHNNISTTLKIYTHLDREFKQLNISKFDNYIKSDLDIENI